MERQALTVAGNAIDAMIFYSGANDVNRIFLTTQRDHVDFNLAFIGTDFTIKAKEPFDPDFMNALYNYARDKARAGYQWAKIRRGFRRGRSSTPQRLAAARDRVNERMSRMSATRRSVLFGLPPLIGGVALRPDPAQAASARTINHDVDLALRALYSSQPNARHLGQRAQAVLIFPKIVKAGLLIGGQTGDGALRVGGRTVGYYNISAASFGLQAGVQTFSYAMFFMTASSLKYLSDSDGWAIGSGPSVVIVDQGAAKSFTTTTLTQDVYAFPFGQRGLMAGIELEGSKITHIHPGP